MYICRVTLNNFRRFRGVNSLVIPTRVFAMIGQNEGGKSSLLRALAHIQSEGPIPDEDISHGVTMSANEVVIQVDYWIEDEDRKSLDDRDYTTLKYLRVNKHKGGQRIYECPPVPDTTPVEELRSIRLMVDEKDGEEESLLAESLDSLLSSLSPSSTPDHGALVLALKKIVSERPNNTPIDSALHEAITLADIMDMRSRAWPRLARRVPGLLEFTEADRALEGGYEIQAIGDHPPQALANLLSLAELTPLRLREAMARGSVLHQLEADANSRLNKALHNKWSQVPIEITFRVQLRRLEIYVREVGDTPGNYTSLAERSDGLKQFIALVALITRQRVDRPILVIDEAEQHLHYDAQADLMRILQSLRIVSQVIYTTHSAGCLPNDLGKGVGGVATLPAGWSKFVNNFWHSESGEHEPSMRPLLMGLGASTMAFLPLRPAVLVEGVSDALLLPELLRESTNEDLCGFQIVPGLAMADLPQLKSLAPHSKSSAYLCDNDPSGRDRIKLLKTIGVPDRFCFLLPRITIENCVSKTAYLEAVNNLLAHTPPMTLADLDDSHSRSDDLKRWCKEHNVKNPSKPAVAYALLSLTVGGARIVEEDAAAELKALYKETARVLGLI